SPTALPSSPRTPRKPRPTVISCMFSSTGRHASQHPCPKPCAPHWPRFRSPAIEAALHQVRQPVDEYLHAQGRALFRHYTIIFVKLFTHPTVNDSTCKP